jgi:hypothetical protein
MRRLRCRHVRRRRRLTRQGRRLMLTASPCASRPRGQGRMHERSRSRTGDPTPRSAFVVSKHDIDVSEAHLDWKRQPAGKTILGTFGDIAGSFPDLLRPAPPCADKRPVVPRIRHHGRDGDSRGDSHSQG